MTDNNYGKKELRYSLKVIKNSFFAFVGITLFMFILSLWLSEGDVEFLLDSDIVFKGCIMIFIYIIFTAVELYQRKNNVLYFDDSGFTVAGNDYAYSQVSHFKTVHRGRYGTYYHVYVGGQIVFKFSRSYENKDEFISFLQEKGVKFYL